MLSEQQQEQSAHNKIRQELFLLPYFCLHCNVGCTQYFLCYILHDVQHNPAVIQMRPKRLQHMSMIYFII